MDQPLIFKQYKELSRNVPWVPLGQFPTPVERLENLEKKIGLQSLWIKRDDLSGEIYGGNKVRTLEFCLAEAARKQADIIFTYSALGSNWPLACVIYAKLKGWPTDVFFLPKPLDSNKEKNLVLTHKLARRVIFTKSLWSFPFILYFHLKKAKREAVIYLTPPVGTSPLTTLGHANAVFELKEQCKNGEAPIPDFIFCQVGLTMSYMTLERPEEAAIQAKEVLRINPDIRSIDNFYVNMINDPKTRERVVDALHRAGLP